MIPHGVVRARTLLSDQAAKSDAPQWCLAELCGRLCELVTGSAAIDAGSSALLTAAAQLMADAQRMGEPVAWICAASALFFPPDLQSNGIDLQSVTIVRVTDAQAAAQAADQLLRSGCFGLVVIDLSAVEATIGDAVLGRLGGLARTHRAAVLFLCNLEAITTSAAAATVGGNCSELGSIVSLRAHARSRALTTGRFLVEIEVSKDKRRGIAWRWTETCDGPPGLS